MELFTSNRPQVIIFGSEIEGEAQLHSLMSDVCDLRVLENIQSVVSIIKDSAVPTLLLVDLLVPKSSVLYLFEKIREDTRSFATTVLFYGQASSDKFVEYYSLGAAGHVQLPAPCDLIASILKAHLAQYTQLDLVRLIGSQLEETNTRRTKAVLDSQDVTLHAVASLAEGLHVDVSNHIRRTQNYVLVLCDYLKCLRKNSIYLSESLIERIYHCAPYHDIGIIGIPDYISSSTERLTDADFEILKSHTTIGMQAIEQAEATLNLKSDFLTTAKEIAYCHHERWDGSGYPLGIAGEAIPFSARLMAISDVYDALTSARAYKKAIPHSKAVEIIKDGSGSHFDPEIVDAFLIVQDKFKMISEGTGT